MSFLSQFTSYSFPHLGMVRLPIVSFDIEQKKKLNLKPHASNLDILHALARRGFKSLSDAGKIPKEQKVVYGNRAKYELAIFDELGFVDYVLLVWLVIEKARELGTFIDYGRGSCAGSLIFWFLGITGVNPIEKNLLFERFVSRVRSKKQVIDGVTYLQGDLIADADLNLGTSREAIIEWLRGIYPNRISKISTLSTLTGKVLIKDVYKAYGGATEDKAKYASDLIEKHHGIVADIEKLYESNKEFRAWADENKETYDIALTLRDLIRQKSSHASGYLVSFYDLYGYLPLELNKDKELMASYEMRDVSGFAVKLDLLGLITNSIIQNILTILPQLDINTINLDNDPLIYDQFQHGTLLPYGLYQISADCAYGVTNEIKPKNIFELSDVNACARPGALDYVGDYVKGNAVCPHPIFEKILKPTRYLCLYQEQMMQMAVALGFTLDESEILRKIVGKKEVKKVEEWKERIYQKVAQGGYDKSLGDIFWKILDDSSKYSFNASHSLATSYLSALTVYLKYKYPLQFYWACLKATRELPNPLTHVAIIAKELKYFGIKLFAPNLSTSSDDFTIEGNNIRFGLSHIRGISDATMKKLVSFRRNFANKYEIFNAAQEAKIPISVLTGLIFSGAIETKTKRSRLALEAQTYWLLTDREKQLVHKASSNHMCETDDLLDILVCLKERTDENGKPYIRESRWKTFLRDYAPYKAMYLENSKSDELASYVFERHFLGFSYSHTLHELMSKRIEGLIPLSQVLSEQKDTYVHFAALVDETKKTTSRNKKPYLKMTVSDESGSLKAMLFGEDRINASEQFNGGPICGGEIVIIHGKTTGDGAVFVDSLVVQPNPITVKRITESS